MSYDLKTLHKRTLLVGGNTIPILHAVNKNNGHSEAVRMVGGQLVPFSAINTESPIDEAKKAQPEKKKEARKKIFMDLKL